MRLRFDAYSVPKVGNREDEYEDAFASNLGRFADSGVYRFAVADGATVSWHPKIWAKMLAREAVEGRLNLTDEPIIASLQREWADSVSIDDLPWYAEEIAGKGAFAALVMLELVDYPEREWRAIAVGDSCLFHLRTGQLQTSFPIAQSADFDQRPYLIGSRSDGRDLASRQSFQSSFWEPGDLFLLMSDALARWFLIATENGCRPQDEVLLLAGQEEPEQFRKWIDELRGDRRIQDDDTTLLRIKILD